MKRLQLSANVRARMHYKKFAGEAPRMLVLQSDYWLDRACRTAAEMMGWQARHVAVPAKGVLPREHIAALLLALLEFRPDFVLTINLSGMDVDGLFARLFEDLQIPYVTWFVDDPRTILMGRNTYATPYAMAFTWERAYLEHLKGCGFLYAEWLPLAVDPGVFAAEPPNDAHGPAAFVGNSMAAPAAEEWAWAESHPNVARAVRDALDAGHVTRETFAEGLDAMLSKPEPDAMDADERRHAELLLFVEGTRRLRAEWAAALEPHGLRVHGDPGWRAVIPAAREAIRYYDDLARHYRSCSVNLNSTSIQMAAAVNQRVFDCPATGGFLLTDSQSDLDALFEPGEFVCYRSVDECRDLMTYYRSRPESRRPIVERAQRRIFAEHTYAHRLNRMVARMREIWG